MTKENLNIRDIIEKETGRIFKNKKILCPFHDDHDPSFCIDEEKQIFHCFGCGAKGDVIEFIQKYRNIDFKQAVQVLGITPNYADKNKKWDFTREHIYTDEKGFPIAKKEIYATSKGKAAIWYRKENSKWERDLNGLKPPLFDVNKVIGEQHTIYIAEGEKDALTLQKMGYIATTSPNGAGSRWNKDHNKYLNGKHIIIIKDNDNAGEKYAENIAKNIIDDVLSIKIIDPVKILPSLKNKGDITDVVEVLGMDETKTRLQNIVASSDNYIIPENEEKVNKTAGFEKCFKPKINKNGEIESYTILEPLFAKVFKEKYKYYYVNNNFYSDMGQVKKGYVKQLIQQELEQYFTYGLATKVNNLLEVISNICYIEPPEPNPNKIHCKNATLILNDDLSITSEPIDKEDFTFNRFDVNYIESAPEPKKWINFLRELLHQEDIITLQQYLGYCLIPTTKAQASLFIIGKGGEGKSRLGIVLQSIFNGAFISDKLHRLEDDKFLLARLENKLIFYDDDLNTKKLTETGTFKQLVTNEIKVQAEAKGRDKYDFMPYTRFISCGNTALSSCFDKSDGFYRRLIILTCKPKDPNREDNRDFIKTILDEEKESIFKWFIDGLIDLAKNNFIFTLSARAKITLENLKNDDCNILQFMADNYYIEEDEKGSVATKDLLELYKIWCNENAHEPLANRTFTLYLRENKEKFNILEKEQTKSLKGNRARGYTGIKFTYEATKKLHSINNYYYASNY